MSHGKLCNSQGVVEFGYSSILNEFAYLKYGNQYIYLSSIITKIQSTQLCR